MEFKSLLDDKDDIMWFHAILLPYLTGWTLLIENISLMVFGVLVVIMLILFVGGLMAIVLLTVLLPIHLFGLLQLAIRKIALRLQNEFIAFGIDGEQSPNDNRAKGRGVMKQAKILSIEDQLKQREQFRSEEREI